MSELDRVRRWAEALIALHLDEHWSFEFDHAKRRAGACHFTSQRITVSRYLAAQFDDDAIHQILLHEIAHALAGPKAGHGPKWRRLADDLGYSGGRTHDGPVAAGHARWIGRCPAGHEHLRFRRPTRDLACAVCSRRFSRANLIRWTAAP